MVLARICRVKLSCRCVRRDVPEGAHGWTVCLDDHGDIYECAGNDYVLDLLSEVEIPPQFPFGHAHNLVHLLKGSAADVTRRDDFKQM